MVISLGTISVSSASAAAVPSAPQSPTSSLFFAACATTSMGCVVGGLATGSSYYVDVIATKSAGSSGASNMRLISPGKAGSPPTNVTASSDSSGR